MSDSSRRGSINAKTPRRQDAKEILAAEMNQLLKGQNLKALELLFLGVSAWRLGGSATLCSLQSRARWSQYHHAVAGGPIRKHSTSCNNLSRVSDRGVSLRPLTFSDLRSKNTIHSYRFSHPHHVERHGHSTRIFHLLPQLWHLAARRQTRFDR